DSGDEVVVQAGGEGIRFLLGSGKPLEEPVAWYGPIVMKTQKQLQQAFPELEKGTFLRKPKKRRKQWDYKFNERKRSALPITETELKLIAALAIIGLSSQPANG